MIPDIGGFALQLALLAAAIQVISAKRKWPYAGAAACTVWLLLSLAFGSLIYAHATSDFSVLNVAVNSHTAKPLLYKITGAWGNHEGSMLLFAWMLSGFTAWFALTSRYSSRETVVMVQGMILAGVLLYMLLVSNPFERIFPAPFNGQGLNPLLQDIGLALHPPLLYLGYTGFSLAFSFAIAGLGSARVDKEWGNALRPWLVVSWSMLTLGVGLGSWWAYRELGWGGFWFWDPVENCSLLPWLTSIALIHTLAMVRKRDAFKRWAVFLALATFVLALLGFFLVRSGILTSVHSFANDPARGIFILALMGAVAAAGFTLFAWRAPRLESKVSFSFLSRETGLLLNNLLLVTLCATVMLGTLYPIFAEVIGGQYLSVGAPYYHKVFVPIALALLAVSIAGPHMPWGHFERPKPSVEWLLFIFMFGIFPFLWPSYLGGLGIAIGFSIIASAGNLWKQRWRTAAFSFHGMTLAHIGLGILVLGISILSSTETRTEKMMKVGESIPLAPNTGELRFVSMEVLAGPNYFTRTGTFEIWKNGAKKTTLTPETRFYPIEKQQTTESAIHSAFFSDLYVVIGDIGKEGRYAVRVYNKPFIQLIWIGCALIAAGGLLALWKKRA